MRFWGLPNVYTPFKYFGKAPALKMTKPNFLTEASKAQIPRSSVFLAS
jgi:hypothetical protein